MFKTLDEVKNYCTSNHIQIIDFKMIDIWGRWRHLSIPVERFSDQTLTQGIGFDGSNYGFAPVEKSDMVFIPDISTAFLDPFVKTPTLSMIGDVYIIGNPHRRFEQYPRNVATNAEEYLKSSGIADEMRIGPEFEFYVFDHISYETKPHSTGFVIDAEQAEWNTPINNEQNRGYKVPLKGGYHIAPPMDVLYDLRSEMCLLLEERGVAIKYHHPEVGGPGQSEIEVESGPLRELSDKTMLIKYIVKNHAFNNGKTVTFMPKPLFGEAGSGMHVHIHLFKGGKPVFYDANGYSGLSKIALSFIGGLLTHAPALLAFTNPSTNSYKRLIPGYEAPVSICYATANRSAVIRIPDYARTPDQKRFEIRCPDATCNPYYAFSAILMAGLDGVEKGMDPEALGFGPYDTNLYNLPKAEQAKIKSLPRSLEEALNALEKDYEFLLKGNVFSQRLIEIWLEKKREEVKWFNQIPHPAEFALYYDL
ncbi:MAG: type I glutamate--ammonia ligase [Bacillota bacterium]|jgi:glutamine synthetase|nr:type I glutamate--ammonia ligase [Clostridia bacterium]